MVTTLNKTDRLLTEVLREVREVRSLVEPISRAVATQKKGGKKLPKWLQASLKDIEMGRVSGPFNTVKELMANLNSPGE
ncbi:MAG: hypothetical protein Q7S05_01010 [bacterium]|nr:hypothetical protein [bacterium]